jgi:hypothetical protein
LVETTLKTLIERFRSKPEWQHADPAVRSEAVLHLPSSAREILLALAREDPDPRVRRAALKKLPDPAVLAEIAASDADGGVRDEAEGHLAHLAVHEHDEGAARAAVAGIREAKHFAAGRSGPAGHRAGRAPLSDRSPGVGVVGGHPTRLSPSAGSRTGRRSSPWP